MRVKIPDFILSLASASALLLVGSPSHACDARREDLKEVAARAETILVAYVTGERYPDYEAEVLDGEDPDSVDFRRKRVIRVAVVEVRRGQTEERIMEIPVACGSSAPEVFERVTVAIDAEGAPAVWAAKDEEMPGRRWFGEQ